MEDPDASLLARQVITALAAASGPEAWFRMTGSHGSPDGSVTIDVLAIGSGMTTPFAITVSRVSTETRSDGVPASDVQR